MNLALIERPPRTDARDWLVLVLVAAGFLASWAYVFLHPSAENFAICVGGQGTFIAGFHLISVHDDKLPDRKDGA